MIEHKRIERGFEWVAEGFARVAPPAAQPETRVPVFWLNQDDDDLFLVNDSGETLSSVQTSISGFETCDDDVLTMSGGEYCYQNVLPHEAVKVEAFDPVLDSDYVFQLDIMIQRASLERTVFRLVFRLQNLRRPVLLWNSGEAGKYVHMDTPGREKQ